MHAESIGRRCPTLRAFNQTPPQSAHDRHVWAHVQHFMIETLCGQGNSAAGSELPRKKMRSCCCLTGSLSQIHRAPRNDTSPC